MSTGVLAGLVVALFAAAVAGAGPAAAIDDPARPDSRVTHGPSCHPGGLVVEVRAGTVPYTVRLATTRQPAAEDEVALAPGQTALLRSDDVAWGETIDGRLEFSADDGSGVTYVDELDDYSFTRPSQEDCEAITAPASPSSTTPAPSRPGTSAPVPTPTDGTQSAPAPAPAPPSPSPPGDRTPTPTAGGQGSTTTPPAGGPSSTASSRRVAAGSTVTLSAAGFRPGERVTILLHAGGAVLGSAVAAADGTVHAEVLIPRGTPTGTQRLDLVGDSSAVVSNLDLQVAAEETAVAPRGTLSLWALMAAAIALVASVAALVSVAGARRSTRRTGLSSGSA